MRKIKILILMLVALFITACQNQKPQVVIYTAAEDYRISDMQEQLRLEYPEINVIIESFSSSELFTKLNAEGEDTICDIVFDIEYLNAQILAKQDLFTTLNDYDTSAFVDDTVVLMNGNIYFLPEYKNGGAIIVNKKVLQEKNLPIPATYADLIRPEYKGLITMPNPQASGTGYMFYLAWANQFGTQGVMDYVEELSKNIFEFTSSGSKPVTYLTLEEAGIALGMTGNAVTKINEDNSDLQIIIPDGGSPYCLYGYSMIKGKEDNTSVRIVFDYIYNEYIERNNERFYPERIYQERDYTSQMPNFPQNIEYADMSNYDIATKEMLLEKWGY